MKNPPKIEHTPIRLVAERSLAQNYINIWFFGGPNFDVVAKPLNIEWAPHEPYNEIWSPPTLQTSCSPQEPHLDLPQWLTELSKVVPGNNPQLEATQSQLVAVKAHLEDFRSIAKKKGIL